MLGEDRDVLTALAKRRQAQRHDGETVIEILAESTGVNRREKVLVGRSDDREIHGLAAGAAEAAHAALLNDVEKLGLERVGQERDFVEQDGSTVSTLKEAGFRLSRIREGAALEAEQLGLEQARGNRRAVDINERSVATRSRAMDQPGDQVLSGTGFALEQDRWKSPARRRSLDDLADLLAKSTYYGRSANQVAAAL
jgi:hypothetical protein